MHPCTPSAVILPMERESSTFCSLLLPPPSLYGANHQPLLSPRPSVVTKNKLFFLSLLPPPTLSMNCLHFWINSLFSLRQPFWVLKHRKVLKQTSISCPFQPPQPRRRHNWYVYEPDFAQKKRMAKKTIFLNSLKNVEGGSAEDRILHGGQKGPVE